MRIGVNLLPLRPGLMGGAEVYFRDLLSELLAIGDHEFVLVTADYNHDTLPGDTVACRRILWSRQERLARRGVRRLARAVAPIARRLRRWHGTRAAESLQELIRHERLDLWFCPFTNLEPRVPPVPGVITVYDLQHEYHPEFFDAAELAHRRRFYPESCASADHVITISEFTRTGVIERYAVAPERATAIWLAPGSDFDWRSAAARVGAVRRTYDLPARYVFYPANTWRHKNHRRLIEALARHRAQSGDDLALVLTGVKKEAQNALTETVAALGLQDAVRSLGFVPRADLPALYAAAAALVLPSLFEGFGIPLVEAMLVGCPIAAAKVTSIPEVVGDAAELFDPTDVEDIARALGAVVGSPALAAALAARGRTRAHLFSPSLTARRTLEVFETAVRRERAGAPEAGAIVVDGVYDDQWMSAEATVSVRGPGLRELQLEGELPGVAALLPQRLAFSIAGREVSAATLTSPGFFSVIVRLPTNGGHARRWDVSIVPQKTFRPRDHGLSDDTRLLAVRLRCLRATTGDGRVIVKPLGP